MTSASWARARRGSRLALELEATRLRVCLLEAGGSGYEPATQRLFEGEVIGERYPSLRDTRLGALGGSTTVWAGWCRPLEPLDFEPRDWCGAGGWPFGFDELRPYYARAHDICGLADFDYDPAHWAGVLGPDQLLAGDATFTNQIFHVQVQNFGQRYHQQLQRSQNIDLVLHAPITRVRLERGACTASSGPHARRARVRDRRGPLRSRRRRGRECPAPPALCRDAGRGARQCARTGRPVFHRPFVRRPGLPGVAGAGVVGFLSAAAGGLEPGSELGPGRPVTAAARPSSASGSCMRPSSSTRATKRMASSRRRK